MNDKATEVDGYQLPPQEIVDLAESPPMPGVVPAPGGEWLLLHHSRPLIPIQELARPELRLAGVRFDPARNARSRQPGFSRLSLVRVEDGSEREIVGMPEGMMLHSPAWSPDGRRVAFTVAEPEAISLWVAEVQDGQAHRVPGVRLNGIFGPGFSWLPDSRELLCLAVPEDRGPAPDPAPPLPATQENSGRATPSRTYQDLLTTPYDDDVFDYYCQAAVLRVSPTEGTHFLLGQPAMIRRAAPSPDGGYLLVEIQERPFSRLVPAVFFGFRTQVWDVQGALVADLGLTPLAEGLPLPRDAARPGRRMAKWRGDAPATVVWVEARDKDPREETDVRDEVFQLAAPFTGEPQKLLSMSVRCSGLNSSALSPDGVEADGSGVLFVSGQWWKTRRHQDWVLQPDRDGMAPRLVSEFCSQDRYANPGAPLMERGATGHLAFSSSTDGHLFLVGEGASSEGDMPFLDRLNPHTGEKERSWRCQAPYYEKPIAMLDAEGGVVLTVRESVREPPNYFIRNLKTGGLRQLTRFEPPNRSLEEVGQELLHYRRKDGMALSGTLYLPPGKRIEDGPMPLLMWAYPLEFRDPKLSGQVTGSPYRYLQLDWKSPVYLAMRGYAVLDRPSMPIIGKDGGEPNDRYVEELTLNAEAAVEEVVRRGITEPGRIAVGGHSYGSFMTSNLLAHTKFFSAGIARSGAHNRTLTPFGFQGEERTLWEAPEVYLSMTPLLKAHQVEAPMLLIHGLADENDGTYSMQSERMYAALKGNGKTARQVMLPHEGHIYMARESVLHMLWEMITWLERHVK